MKKSKLLILGLIALMLAGGLILASCNLENAIQGKCAPMLGGSPCEKKADNCAFGCEGGNNREDANGSTHNIPCNLACK